MASPSFDPALTADDALSSWLLASDPALRWQVERDLLSSPLDVWEPTRASVAAQGFGARLLAEQTADGQWDGGAYFPADFSFDDPEAAGGGQPWTATTWSLNSLREWGLDAAVLRRRRTAELLAQHSRWEHADQPYWSGEVDCCINAWTVANGVWLGADVAGIAEWMLDHQLPDGGWNCEWVNGARRSSFHSTLNTLKGLLAYEVAVGGTSATRTARRRAEDYLLERDLFKRLSTGAPVAPWVSEFHYPIRWSYDVLNATEYFRQASQLDASEPDPRLAEAMEMIRSARQSDGT